MLPGANAEPERIMLPDVSLVIGWLLREAIEAGLALPSFVPLSESPLLPALLPPDVPSVWPLVPLFSLVLYALC